MRLDQATHVPLVPEIREQASHFQLCGGMQLRLRLLDDHHMAGGVIVPWTTTGNACPTPNPKSAKYDSVWVALLTAFACATYPRPEVSKRMSAFPIHCTASCDAANARIQQCILLLWTLRSERRNVQATSERSADHAESWPARLIRYGGG